MLITRKYSLSIDIEDQNGLFGGNIDSYLERYINNTYIGHCYDNSLLIKLIKIENRSSVRMNEESLVGAGCVDVEFMAEAVIYQLGDIITNCRITNIDKLGYGNCVSEFAGISIKKGGDIKSLSVDNIISLQVTKSEYPHMKKQITVIAVPFIHPQGIIYGYKIKPLNTEEKASLKPLLDKIYESENKLSEIKKKDNQKVDFFINKLYRYKSDKHSNLIKGASNYVKDFRKLDLDGYVIKHSNLRTTEPCVLSGLKKEDLAKVISSEHIIDNMESVKVYNLLLQEYLRHIQLIIEWFGIYHNDEIMKKHNGLWSIYEVMKES